VHPRLVLNKSRENSSIGSVLKYDLPDDRSMHYPYTP
jgi:hypothetical protein